MRCRKAEYQPRPALSYGIEGTDTEEVPEPTSGERISLGLGMYDTLGSGGILLRFLDSAWDIDLHRHSLADMMYLKYV